MSDSVFWIKGHILIELLVLMQECVDDDRCSLPVPDFLSDFNDDELSHIIRWCKMAYGVEMTRETLPSGVSFDLDIVQWPSPAY